MGWSRYLDGVARRVQIYGIRGADHGAEARAQPAGGGGVVVDRIALRTQNGHIMADAGRT